MGSTPKIEKHIPSRGSAGTQFPGKLHDLMTFTEQKGLSDIISWCQNGQAIMIHDPERLLQILPHFDFRQTKYRSFQRQLNMWHWERILDGPYKGGWIHPFFVRGNKILCSFMSRHIIPKLNNVQLLMNQPETSKATMMPHKVPGSMVVIGQDEECSEKIQFPVEQAMGTSIYPLKAVSTSLKNMDDEWEPLPMDDENYLSFEVPVMHFGHQRSQLTILQDDADNSLEPTPIREEADTIRQLLEPISAETIDSIF